MGYLLIVASLEISLLLLELAHLGPQFLGDFDARSHLFLHAGLISIEVIEPGFGCGQGGDQVVILAGEGGDCLVFVLQLDQELGGGETGEEGSTRAHACSFCSVSCLREAERSSRDSGVEPSELDGVLFVEGRRETPAVRAGAGARVGRAGATDRVVGGEVGLDLREGGGVARVVM